MLIGYMRVSERQSVDLQRDALIAAGVDERHLHQDRASGKRDDRPGLKACLADLRPGDVLAVWKLDRLGRSLSHLIRIIDELKGRGVAFRSLTECLPGAKQARRARPVEQSAFGCFHGHGSRPQAVARSVWRVADVCS